MVPQFGGLEITTTSTQLHTLTDAVLYLVSYPYECAEQVSSRMLGVAALEKVLGAFEAEGLPEPDEIRKTVRADIEKLQGLQNYDGGFSFWRRGLRSWPWVTVHVAHALQRAKEAGYEVPSGVLNNAHNYMRNIDNHMRALHYGPDLRAQQRDFDVFTKTYNEVRPHDALGGKTPSDVFTSSTRLYPTKLQEPAYAEHTDVLRADRQGRIKVGRRTISLSPLLGQLPLGIRAASSSESAGIQNVFFGPIQLGYIHPQRGFLRGVPPRGTNSNLHTKHTTRVSAMSPV